MGIGASTNAIRRDGVSAAGAPHRPMPKHGKGSVGNISLELLDAMRGDLLLTKAVAMAIYVKNRTRDARVRDYTLNRLRKLAHLHHSTARKYVQKLAACGLVRMEGGDMVFASLSDRHGRHKISLGDTSNLTIKQLENLLLATQVVLIVEHKEFAKRTIAMATNPTRKKADYDNFKRARQTRRRYGYNAEYHDHGLSYKTIARRLGISLQKAEEVIRYATANGLLVKENRQEQVYIKGIGAATKFFDGARNFTFSTKDNVYIILANCYSLPHYPTGNN